MDYNQFIEKIKTDAKVELFNDNRNKSYIIICWILGDEIEPNFTEFDDIIFLFRSDINVLRYNKLKQILIRCGVEEHLATKRCYLQDIYRVFIKNCFITAKCSMITGTREEINLDKELQYKLPTTQQRIASRTIDIVCGERAITTVQNEPVCQKCFDKFKKNDPDLLDDMEDNNEILPIERLPVTTLPSGQIIPPRIILANPQDLDKFKAVVSRADEDCDKNEDDKIKDEAVVIREKSILDETSLKNLKDQATTVIKEVKKLISTKTISLPFILSLEEIEALKNPDKATREAFNSCVEKGYLTTAYRYLPLGKLLSDKIKSDEAIEALSSLSQSEE